MLADTRESTSRATEAFLKVASGIPERPTDAAQVRHARVENFAAKKYSAERLDFQKVAARADDAHVRAAAHDALAAAHARGPKLAINEDESFRCQIFFDGGDATDETQRLQRRFLMA